MQAIRVEHLTFTYPLAEQPALQNISFAVQPGELVVLCGPSGCGKSTLLRHFKQELQPYGECTGAVWYGNCKIGALPARESVQTFGLVLQSPEHQLVADTVWHELAFGAESLGLPHTVMKRRVAELASYFGIHTWFRKSVAELSGGQKQLLCLAAAMVTQPQVLLLDEPTAQLDPIAAAELLHTVVQLNRELGITVIVCEHHVDELMAAADKAAVLDGGRLVLFDTPQAAADCLRKHGESNGRVMRCAMPTVTQIFADTPYSPLTLREGRQRLLSCTGVQQLNGTNQPPEPAICKEGRAAAQLCEVWCGYGRNAQPVLRGCSLTLYEGEWLSIVGANGAGKSTVLRALCGELRLCGGKVLLYGKNTHGMTDAERFAGGLAMVPQDPMALFTEITVEQELYEGLSHLPGTERDQLVQIEQMLATMQLTELREHNPYDLSGGEQQRLAIGKVLLTKPRILLLDEPTKGLDALFKQTLGDILKQLQAQGLTLCMVSHDLEFCASYSDRCALMFDGEAACVQPPRQFFTGNRFYTTAASRLTAQLGFAAVTKEEARAWVSGLF